MKKKLVLPIVLLSFFICGRSEAQLVEYNFEGDLQTSSAVDGSVSASIFDRNVGNSVSFSTGNGGGRAISGSGWQASSGEFWEFTVTANAGLELDLAGLSFDSRSTGTGPSSWAVSINGINAGSGSLQNNSNFELIAVPLNSFSDLTSAQVRITGSGASSSGGTWRVDNVTLNGLAVTPVPEPTTWLLLSGGFIFLAARFRPRK